jgi:hypothetical protein
VAPRWRRRLVAVLPFVLTAFASVVLTLLVQAVVSGVQVSQPARVASAQELPVAALERQPAEPGSRRAAALAAPLRPDAGDAVSLEAEVAALRRDVDRLWSAYYLSRAANQLADAETALRVNDLSEVEQVLATVGTSLDRAYDRSVEQEKGPISEFRVQVGRMHDELRTRPQGMDQQLRRLRQSMLSLVDEGS